MLSKFEYGKPGREDTARPTKQRQESPLSLLLPTGMRTIMTSLGKAESGRVTKNVPAKRVGIADVRPDVTSQHGPPRSNTNRSTVVDVGDKPHILQL
jgi:hypothetical protein